MKYLLYTTLTLTLAALPMIAHNTWNHDWIWHAYNVYGVIGAGFLVWDWAEKRRRV